MMFDSRRIWPRLANDAIFVPRGRGVLFRNDANAFAEDEEDGYALMRRLAPRLTGEWSLDEICGDHPAGLRPAIERLVARLIERGIVRTAVDRSDPRGGGPRAGDSAGGDPDRDAKLPSDIRAKFAAQLSLIDHLAPEADQRFDWFRQSRVLMMGSGLVFRHCAAALLRNGLQRLWVMAPDRSWPVAAEVQAEAEELRLANLPVEVHTVGETELFSPRPDRLSMIIYAADVLSLHDLARACRRALRDRCLVLPACVLDGQTWLGPLLRAPACGVCTLRRLSDELWKGGQLRHRLGRDSATGNNRDFDSRPGAHEPSARRLGGDAAFAAFKALAGDLRPELAGGVILQTAKGDGTVRAMFAPYTLHWCWGACRPYRPPAADNGSAPC